MDILVIVAVDGLIFLAIFWVMYWVVRTAVRRELELWEKGHPRIG